MNTQNESQGQEEFRKDRPSPEKTAELLAKAKKVTAWLSALKQRSRLRPFVGTSEDGMVVLTMRNYRIEAVNVNAALTGALAEDVLPRVFDAHSKALRKMEEWTAGQCSVLANAAGITGDFELPF